MAFDSKEHFYKVFLPDLKSFNRVSGGTTGVTLTYPLNFQLVGLTQDKTTENNDDDEEKWSKNWKNEVDVTSATVYLGDIRLNEKGEEVKDKNGNVVIDEVVEKYKWEQVIGVFDHNTPLETT